MKRRKKEREDALAAAMNKETYHYRGLFSLMSDAEWGVTCPACGGKAFIASIQVEEVVYEDDEYGSEETVDKHSVGEEFQCPVCDWKHYLQRFWEKLPEHGQIVVFDRSWYGRVLKLTRFERQSPLTAASTLTN